jgi:integrase
MPEPLCTVAAIREQALFDADLYLSSRYGALRLAEKEFAPGAEGKFRAGWSLLIQPSAQTRELHLYADLSFPFSRPDFSRRGLHKDCVGWILKRAASRAGLKPEPLGGHSLRAGCVTQAAINGVSERDIMRQTGHKSAEMLARYIRIGEMFTRNAAAGLGI